MLKMGCNHIFDTALSHKQSIFKLDKVDMDCDKFLEIVSKLYNKYIKFDAIYEINISYQQRLALAILIDDEYKDKKDEFVDSFDEYHQIPKNLPRNNLPGMITIIIPILEQSLGELIRLLQSSLSRFKLTEEYKRICIELEKGEKGKKRMSNISRQSQHDVIYQ